MAQRWISTLIVFAIAGSLAGCGTPHPAAAHVAHRKDRRTTAKAAPQTLPVVVGASSPAPRILMPTRIIAPPRSANTSTNVELRAPLVPGTGIDTIAITVAQQGRDDTLTIISASGRTLWTMPHIRQVGVAEFGAKHLPVLLLGSDESVCGTGGCGYVAYTYSTSSHAFVAVPFSPWQELSYRLNPQQGDWTALPDFSNTNSLLGYASLTAKGISIAFRLYGPLNGAASRQYVYALDGTPTGEWIPLGDVNFGPDARNGFVVPPGTLQEAVNEYLAETMQNHPAAAATFVAPSATAGGIAAATAFMRSWGLSGGVRTVQATGPAEIQVAVWTTSGTGPAERLQTDLLRISGTQISGKWYLTHMAVTPQTGAFDTAKAVLELLAQDPNVRAWYAAHPSSALSLQGQANQWSAFFSLPGNRQGLTLNVDASTGVIRSTKG